MVDDAGSIYPLMRVMPLESAPPSIPAKSPKRYVRIYPSLDNTLIDHEFGEELESGNGLESIPLGLRATTEREFAW